jgi:hypothetical protein
MYADVEEKIIGGEMEMCEHVLPSIFDSVIWSLAAAVARTTLEQQECYNRYQSC